MWTPADSNAQDYHDYLKEKLIANIDKIVTSTTSSTYNILIKQWEPTWKSVMQEIIREAKQTGKY